MTSEYIIQEIEKMPLADKLMVMERTIQSIRGNKGNSLNSLEQAVDTLYDDYKQDKELTAFTQLDMESFYEAK